MKGFLVVLDSKQGNIIRKTDIFKQFKRKKRLKIKPIGFIMGSKNIYLTTNHGRLLVVVFSYKFIHISRRRFIFFCYSLGLPYFCLNQLES